MKKLYVVFILALFFSSSIPVVSAAPTRLECLISGDASSFSINKDNTYGQTFTVGTVGSNAIQTLTSVKLKMYKTGSPGTLFVGIRATNGEHPTGGNLYTGSIGANTFTTDTGGAWYEISLTGSTVLQPNTKYAIVCYNDDEGANQVRWRSVWDGSAYPNGMAVIFQTGEPYWIICPSIDMLFDVYGETGPIVTTNAASSIDVNSSTLNGYLNSAGTSSTTVCFEYGKTDAYGSVTTNQSKTTGESFTQELTGLDPGTMYHFRSKATNDVGVTYGTGRTFITESLSPGSFEITFPSYKPAGSDIFLSGMLLNGTGVGVAVTTQTRIYYSNNTVALGPYYWYTANGNYQCFLSTTSLQPGYYYFKINYSSIPHGGEFYTTHSLALGVPPGNGTYVPSKLTFSFYDVSTGFGLPFETYKLFVSDDSNITSADRKYTSVVDTYTNKLLYYQIKDFYNNIIYPTTPIEVIEGGLSGDWDYYKEITVSDNILGYQTFLNITKSSGGDVDCEGHSNSNFSDLRFTAENGTFIPFWIETKVDNNYAHVWVNNKWNETTLYMLYGNSTAAPASDGASTFELFDDFDAGSLNTDLWDATGTPTFSSGYIEVKDGSGITSKNTYGIGTAVRANWASISSGSLGANSLGYGYWITDANTTSHASYGGLTYQVIISVKDSTGTNSATSYDKNDGVYRITDLRRNTTTSNLLFINSVIAASITTSNNIPTGDIALRFATRGSETDYIGTARCYWILVRKYVYEEPSFNFGEEQGEGSPTSTYYVEPVYVTSINQFENIPINALTLSIKNMNSSIVKTTLRNGTLARSVWIYPYEPYFFNYLRSAEYNLTIEYYNPVNETLVKTTKTNVSVFNDTYYWIRGYDLRDIIIEINAINTSLGNLTVNITTAVNISGSSINTIVTNIVSNLTLTETNLTTLINTMETNIALIDTVVNYLNNTIWSNLTIINTTIDTINNKLTINFNLLNTTVDYINNTIWVELTTINSTIGNIESTIISKINISESNIVNLSNDIWNAINITDSVVDTINNKLDIDFSILNTTIHSIDNRVNINFTMLQTNVTNMNNTIHTQLTLLDSNIDSMNTSLSNSINIIDSIVGYLNNTIWTEISIVNSTVDTLNNLIITQITAFESNISSQLNLVHTSIYNTESNITTQLNSISADITNSNTSIISQVNALFTSISNTESNITTQLNTVITDISNTNTTIHAQFNTIQTSIVNTETNITTQLNGISTSITNTESNITTQLNVVEISISNSETNITNQVNSINISITNMNTSIYNQLNAIVTDISNTNTTVVNQANLILTSITNTNSTIHNQLNTINNMISNFETNITAQVNIVLTNLTNTNSSIYGQLNVITTSITNTETNITNQLTLISTDITNTNTSIHTQLNLVATSITNTETNITNQLNSIEVMIGNTETNVTNQINSIGLQITNSNTTIHTQLNSIITEISNTNLTVVEQANLIISSITTTESNITNQLNSINAQIITSESNLTTQINMVITDITNANSTIHTQVNAISAQITNMNTSITDQLNIIEVNITNMNTSIDTQINSIMTTISNHDTNLTTQVNTILSAIENSNTSIIDQVNLIWNSINNTNSSIGVQITGVSTTISNFWSDVNTSFTVIQNEITYTNTTIHNLINDVNATLVARLVGLLDNVTNEGETVFNKVVDVLDNISSVNTSLQNQILLTSIDIMNNVTNYNYNQTLNVISNITAINSSLFSEIQLQALNIINSTQANLSYINTTIGTLLSGNISTLISEIHTNVTQLLYDVNNMTFNLTGNLSVNLTEVLNQLSLVLENLNMTNVSIGNLVNVSIGNLSNVLIRVWEHQNVSFSDLQNRSTVVFNFYNTNEGLGLNRETLRVYVNGTRLIDNLFLCENGSLINLTIMDYYDFVLYQNNFTINSTFTFIDLGLTFHSWLFGNKNEQYYMVSLLREGGIRWYERGIVPYGEREFLLPSGNYTLRIYDAANNELYNTTHVINNSRVYVIEGSNLSEIISGQSVIRGQLLELQSTLDEALQPNIVLVSENPPRGYSVYESTKLNTELVCPVQAITATTRNTSYVNGSTVIYPLIPTTGTIYIKRDLLYLEGTATWVNISYTNFTHNYSYLPSRVEIPNTEENVTINASDNITFVRETTFEKQTLFYWTKYVDLNRYESTNDFNNTLDAQLYQVYLTIEYANDTTPDYKTTSVYDVTNGILLTSGESYTLTASGIHMYLDYITANSTRSFTTTYYSTQQEIQPSNAVTYATRYELREFLNSTYYYLEASWYNIRNSSFIGTLSIQFNFDTHPYVISTRSIAVKDITNNRMLNREEFAWTGSSIEISQSTMGTVPANGIREFGVYFKFVNEEESITQGLLSLGLFGPIQLIHLLLLVLGAFAWATLMADKNKKKRKYNPLLFLIVFFIFLLIVLYIYGGV